MRQHTILVILSLAFIPLAAADGPSASLTTLTSGDGCSSSSDGQSWSGNGTYDNGSRGYGYYGSTYASAGECASHADTLAANASDRAGPIADARVYQENASSAARHDDRSSGWSSGPGSYSYGSSEGRGGASGNSDERGARADALGATTGEASGCARSDSFQDDAYDSSWYATFDDGMSRSGSSSQRQFVDQHENTCGDQVYASIGGHGASAGDTWSCSFDYASSAGYDPYSYGDSWSYGDHQDRAGANDCRNGEAAQVEDQALFVGQDDACSTTNHTSERSYGQSNGSSGYDSDSYGTSRCFRGYIVDGPDGMRVSAGNWTQAHESCTNGECSSQSSEQQGIAWAWGASPVQFLAQGGVTSPISIPLLA